MTRYARGRRFEWRLAAILRDRGAMVIRSAGSHGEADLIALWPHDIPWAIQAKTRKPTKAERESILDAARSVRARWYMVYPNGDGEIQWDEVTP